METTAKTHETVKYKLKLAGWTLTRVGKELGVAQSTVTTVCQGYRKSHRIQKFIADQLGTTPELLWPERYPIKKETVQ